MSRCERILSDLSAFVDGELSPMESIVFRRHLERCSSCRRAQRATERLKVGLHVVGSRHGPSPELRARYRMAVQDAARDSQTASFGFQRRLRRWCWLPALAGALAFFLFVAATSKTSFREIALAVEVVQPARLSLDGEVLSALVEAHRAESSSEALSSLVSRGLLMTFEHLPDTFIEVSGRRVLGSRASVGNCDPRSLGSSLAVLRPDRIAISDDINAALEATGIYLSVIDGVDVRVSLSGERVFVLLSGNHEELPAI